MEDWGNLWAGLTLHRHMHTHTQAHTGAHACLSILVLQLPAGGNVLETGH